jgi:hypothetical protein
MPCAFQSGIVSDYSLVFGASRNKQLKPEGVPAMFCAMNNLSASKPGSSVHFDLGRFDPLQEAVKLGLFWKQSQALLRSF